MDASFKANKILKQEKISDTFKGFLIQIEPQSHLLKEHILTIH